jgi:hypothetical protein
MLTKVEQIQNDLRIWQKTCFEFFNQIHFVSNTLAQIWKNVWEWIMTKFWLLKLSLIWLCLNLNILYPASACIAWKHLIAAAASKSGKPRVSLFLLFFCLVESVGTGLVRFSFKWHFLFSFFPFFWKKILA